MSVERHRRWLAGLAALVALPSFALERGEFHDGLYTAPGQLFTAHSPLGSNTLVIDSFDRSAGAVTFLDEKGDLYGVICTPNFDVLAGADNEFETDVAILRNWLHDATFPLFFERQLPGSTILHEGPGSFQGRPAWFGLMRLPQGSPRIAPDPETGLPTRQDSYRGIVVFMRDEMTYLLMTETMADQAWDAFLPRLANFYRGMEFNGIVPIPVDQQIADLLD